MDIKINKTKLSLLQRRKLREAEKFNKWLKSEGSTLVYDPLIKTKFYSSHLAPKVNMGNFKIREELKDKLHKWAWEDRLTTAAYLRKILTSWEKMKDKKDKIKYEKNE